MNIVTSMTEWRAIRRSIKDKTIGFVPTMGNLHAGHISLCTASKNENDITIVSIFINPTQFNQASDFEKYPRTIDADSTLLEKAGVDYLLLPTQEDLYPDQYTIKISEEDIANELEGAYRPGHFTGMLTIVNKLLNLAQADNAYFGEKDYQQLLLVKKMVTALMMPTNIIGCKTERDHDGLALSSRNSRLSIEERALASHFPRILQSDLALEKMQEALEAYGFKVDYIAEKWNRRLGAVWVGDVRLIDNIELKK
jgi:pantoate--beta-alanine ligase